MMAWPTMKTCGGLEMTKLPVSNSKGPSDTVISDGDTGGLGKSYTSLSTSDLRWLKTSTAASPHELVGGVQNDEA